MELLENYVEVGGAKIHYIERGKGRPVILHHGARFNARTWEETGTVSAIAEVGFRAISVDFPGFGRSERGNFSNLSEFIGEFVKALGLERPILLGASMGGEAVLAYAVDNREKVGGLILVGAVGVTNYESNLSNLDGLPVLLIWGKNDTVSPKRNYEAILGHVKTARLEIVGSQHACYLDDPKGFNEKIKEFLKGL
ncbi:MAG: alpha/beta hydrolase [Candidatus Aramenus sp.]|jgi:pimeloyl-ACP methyl ester carboxylesterase|nr:alpha/beta hydrolase [Candidatus Aramenus sp.]